MQTVSVYQQRVQSFPLSGDLGKDVEDFLLARNCPKLTEHSLRVGAKARRLAGVFGMDPEAAFAAGVLHDVSGVFPNGERVEVARELGIEVLAEEEAFPMIIHQKISRHMAREVFGITDEAVLSAIECHTTLKAEAGPMDLLLFVADKIEWDQIGTPPYLARLLPELQKSLEHAAFAYISYLWENKENLKVVHPWLAAAYHWLLPRIEK